MAEAQTRPKPVRKVRTPLLTQETYSTFPDLLSERVSRLNKEYQAEANPSKPNNAAAKRARTVARELECLAHDYRVVSLKLTKERKSTKVPKAAKVAVETPSA
jgi:hypothetical protein